MTSPTETAPDHQTAPEDDQNMPELIWKPAGAVLDNDPQQRAPAASGDPAEVDMGSGAAEPGIADEPETPEAPETFVAPEAPETFVAPEAPETFVAPVVVLVPAADPEPAPAAPVAGDNVSPSTSWHEVLAMFVDDPRSSTERAAGLVDDSVERLVVSVRERQHALLSAWQGDDAGTEEMRTAVQHYRTFAGRLEDFSREA
jgi:hypothetical protein